MQLVPIRSAVHNTHQPSHPRKALRLLSGVVFAAALAPLAGAATVGGPVSPNSISAPSITSQPASATRMAGQTATFSVGVSSASSVSYQWYRDGTRIGGATGQSYALTAQPSASGASFAVVVANGGGATTSATARLTVNAVQAAAQAATADRPFSDRSPWNARPTRFTLGTAQIPTSLYFPTVAEGSFSVGVFRTTPSDPSITVYGPAGGNGIYVADSETYDWSVVIPHWPANVVPAWGGDGHADVVDEAANRIHSFYQLKLENGVWRAAQYTWTPLDGRGFGTPATYASGSRAAGVVPMAGLIRKQEVNDGAALHKHALAMSLAANGLSATSPYVFPATKADGDAASVDSGSIPEGALLMLPASFDVEGIANPYLRKVARTLQTYGAYVVDRNVGTPFVIYAELGTNYNLMWNGWDNVTATDLDRIRAALRQVVSATEWVDAAGNVFVPETKLNLLSMRGYWWPLQGGTAAPFDTWEQAVVFPANGIYTSQVNAGGHSMPKVKWASTRGGAIYQLKVKGTGGASFRLDLVDAAGSVVYSSGYLQDGATLNVTWPQGTVTPYTYAASGAAGGGKIGATLIEQ